MKHLKTFEGYSDDMYDSYINLGYIKNMSSKDIDILLGQINPDFKNVEDDWLDDEDFSYEYNNSLNALTSFINTIKSFGSEDDKITLYRVLNVSSIDEIRKDKLGEHYTTSPNKLDSTTLFDIGVNINKFMSLVEVKVRIGDINMNNTLHARVEYPHESEISLVTDENVEIVNISEFKVRY